MSSPYHRAERALMSLEQRTKYDERNRLTLLGIHGVMGVVVGWLMLAYGTPDAWTEAVGPDRDWMLASPALAGGTLLLAALYLLKRNLLLEAAGMVLILGWDLTMVYILNRFGLNPYAVAVYVTMAALMLVHVGTLAAYVWARRRSQ